MTDRVRFGIYDRLADRVTVDARDPRHGVCLTGETDCVVALQRLLERYRRIPGGSSRLFRRGRVVVHNARLLFGDTLQVKDGDEFVIGDCRIEMSDDMKEALYAR